MTDTSKKELNKEQLASINHKTGPLLIIAGAGTGKTTVITERVKNLITKELAKHGEILALTFTEKAAREMEERIDIALPYGYTQMWISTFHSFCDRILRSEALQIGLDPRYKLMTESEIIQLIRSNLFEFELNYFRPLGNPNKFISGMINHFSRLQDEDITPDEYFEWASRKNKKKNTKTTEEERLENEKWLELATAYKKYEELKVKNGLMDFGDMITKVLKIFRERKNILESYKKQFKYILVDEFQDTNVAQNELVKLLAGKNGNITVVADDDQSVYRFRGAAVSNVLAFRADFPKTKIIVLSKNYRSTQEILDRSHDLIEHNNPDRLEVVEKINKKLVSTRKLKGDEITFIHTDRVENEADEVAKKIKELVKSGKYNWEDIAILVRANNHSEPFSRSLLRNGIPFQFLGPGRLFKQPEVVDLISYLKVLYNFEDSVSFYRVLATDYFDIDGRDLAALGNHAKKYNLSLFETAEKINELTVSEKTKEKINLVVEMVKKHLDLAKKDTAGQILYYFMEDSGLMKKLIDADDPEAQKRATNISKFFDKVKSYEVDHEDAGVVAVVDWINLATEVGESPLAADTDWGEVEAVSILTVHSAKGLEFPVVFLVNLVSQRFPSMQRREQIPIPEELIKEILPKGDFHEEEERRLFYVGMTRAKDLLFLTAANYYGEAKREKKLSPFIFEAIGENATPEKNIADNSKQLSFLDYKQDGISKDSKKIPLKIDYLSYSQIETFKTCPLHYKLKYILKIPTPQSPAQSFGTSIHATLKDFYEAVGSGQKPTEKLAEELLIKNWIRDGYQNKNHEQKMIKEGNKFLASYLENFFDKNRIPVAMEQPFLIPLTATGERPLKIGGKIDRIDDLGGGNIEIIDYKTGANVPSEKEVNHDLQLTFYALAATTLKEFPFDRDPKNITVSLYYLNGAKKLSTKRSIGDLEKTKSEIFEIRKQIEESDFSCSGGFFCRDCEFKLLCSSEEE